MSKPHQSSHTLLASHFQQSYHFWTRIIPKPQIEHPPRSSPDVFIRSKPRERPTRSDPPSPARSSGGVRPTCRLSRPTAAISMLMNPANTSFALMRPRRDKGCPGRCGATIAMTRWPTAEPETAAATLPAAGHRLRIDTAARADVPPRLPTEGYFENGRALFARCSDALSDNASVTSPFQLFSIIFCAYQWNGRRLLNWNMFRLPFHQ